MAVEDCARAEAAQIRMVRVSAALTGGVAVLFDRVGGEMMDRAVRAVRDGGRTVSVIPCHTSKNRATPASSSKKTMNSSILSSDWKCETKTTRPR